MWISVWILQYWVIACISQWGRICSLTHLFARVRTVSVFGGRGEGRKSCLSWSSWQNSSGASPPPGPLLILQHLVLPTQAGTPVLLRGERENLALASFLNTFQSGWVGEKSFSNTLFNLQQNIFKAKQMNLMIPTHNVLSFLGDGSKWRSQALSPACGLDMWQEKPRDCPALISPGEHPPFQRCSSSM